MPCMFNPPQADSLWLCTPARQGLFGGKWLRNRHERSSSLAGPAGYRCLISSFSV